jgi:hypothetical protein
MKHLALLTTITVLAFASQASAVALARDQDDDAVAVARTLNQLCRGMSGDAKYLDEICEARDRAFNVAARLGYCYGKQNQIGAEHRWHKCTRDSNRPQ